MGLNKMIARLDLVGHPRILLAVGITAVLVLYGGAQMAAGGWPDPKRSVLPPRVDAIVVLGGGDLARARTAIRMAERYPSVPVIVTGDTGELADFIRDSLRERNRLALEHDATSTYENATLTDALLEQLGVESALLVTSWYHAPRALAVFEKVQPGRKFSVAFEKKSRPVSQRDRRAQRRERLATVWYLVRRGISSF